MSRSQVAWALWVVAALLLLPVVGGWTYLALVAGTAGALSVVVRPPDLQPGVGTATGFRQDALVILGLYLGVVALMRLAFVGFSTDHVAGLFLSFAAALLLGSVGPVVYTVWSKGGSLADLGLRRDGLAPVAAFALLFAGTQFAITLWSYALPAARDWVPLLVMALVVGVFESIFFRGFLQGRLTERFGSMGGALGAGVLYGAYHVGYGMPMTEIGFLTGLGLVYAAAYAVGGNLVVLWPLLTPLGSFFAQLEAGDIELPWASIAGFVDVAAVIVVALWLAHRRASRTASSVRQRRPV